MTNTVSAINAIKAKKNKKGFTLMEMLIVVAIIAILVAIAIPVFTTQLNNARTQVDAANLRSAESMAVAAYLTTNASNTSPVIYGVTKDDHGNLTVTVDGPGADISESDNYSGALRITVTSGAVAFTTWDTAE